MPHTANATLPKMVDARNQGKKGGTVTGINETQRKLSTCKASGSFDLSEDEYDDEFQDRIKSGSLLYERIFVQLDCLSLLECRQVCKRWNSIVSSEAVLWRKSRALVCNNNTNWLASRGLFQTYYAPNFHFNSCDLRQDVIGGFFQQRGPFLRHLKLTNCLITLPAFQSIMINCENLEHLEISGIPRTLSACEYIFPIPTQVRRFTRLKTFSLKAVEPTQQDIFQCDCNLKPGFLQDLLQFAESLERVDLINFSGRTLNYLTNIVNQHSRYKRFQEFHGTEMRPVVKSIDLIPLCVRTDHINLKKLTISPLTACQKHDFGVMVIRGILRNHRLTLEQLNISNCPVTSAIFRLPVPQLRILIAIGTNISSTVLFQHLTPKLEKAVFHRNQASPRGILERLLSTYNVISRLPSCLSFERYMRGRLLSISNENSSDRDEVGGSPNCKSVIKGFDACTTLDFVTIVLFIMALILLFIFGLSALFRSYALIMFTLSIVLLVFWELYDGFQGSRHKTSANKGKERYFF